jgi:hypothetical protein
MYLFAHRDGEDEAESFDEVLLVIAVEGRWCGTRRTGSVAP